MTNLQRRYDIDWLRVIAIGLLLVYHTSITFQPWGFMIGFITNDKSWELLWTPMTMLNVWRIPILFFISGMGAYFAIQSRNWKQLLRERGQRIGVPFVFGIFCIVPVQALVAQYYYHQNLSYTPNPAHLWFLGNILIYVILLTPFFFYLKKNETTLWVSRLKKILSSPFCLLIVTAALVAEALLVNPPLYELYAMTWHGFFLGFIAFFSGFCFMLGGTPFWNMLLKWRWLFLTGAVALYAYRLLQAPARASNIQLVIESNCWIFSIFAFGYKYLNHPGKAQRYLSRAAYPVYILHMIFLYLAASLLFPVAMDVHLKFFLVLMITVAGCFTVYEFIIKRVNLFRDFFGLKAAAKKQTNETNLETMRLINGKQPVLSDF